LMRAECGGINYAVRLLQGTVEVRSRPFQDRTSTIRIGNIKSVELLRKSVWPPAVIGGASLSLGSILRLANGELIGIVPIELHEPLQYLTFGIAVVCLVVLVVRWFFANLILKPVGVAPIIVRMVPTGSARRFVVVVQGQTPNPRGA
jgi:formate/nitrite transporter FocA (FNT family)